MSLLVGVGKLHGIPRGICARRGIGGRAGRHKFTIAETLEKDRPKTVLPVPLRQGAWQRGLWRPRFAGG